MHIQLAKKKKKQSNYTYAILLSMHTETEDANKMRDGHMDSEHPSRVGYPNTVI